MFAITNDISSYKGMKELSTLIKTDMFAFGCFKEYRVSKAAVDYFEET